MFIISIALNLIFVCLAFAFAYHNRDNIVSKLETLYLRGGVDLQKRLWPNLIRVS